VWGTRSDKRKKIHAETIAEYKVKVVKVPSRRVLNSAGGIPIGKDPRKEIIKERI